MNKESTPYGPVQRTGRTRASPLHPRYSTLPTGRRREEVATNPLREKNMTDREPSRGRKWLKEEDKALERTGAPRFISPDWSHLRQLTAV